MKKISVISLLVDLVPKHDISTKNFGLDLMAAWQLPSFYRSTNLFSSWKENQVVLFSHTTFILDPTSATHIFS